MIDCSLVQSVAQTSAEPASDEAIAAAQVALGCNFPSEYIELLRCSNGIAASGDTSSLILYSVDEIQERNETYRVQQQSPALLMIGDDGGGRGILLEHGTSSSPIYLIGMGSLAIEDAKILAANLEDWLRENLPLDNQNG